ncbi:hypothetical protein A2442_04230 [Candidatus Campbellbacteria bacterium RIFOXYC2_FULL_35_25]|uniref:Transposase IS200-like domain-containing protein n=1 Tax=Candidatus Campbellbacteria bacterium RIFOXYC2_FULL_35_25 TaxID=1797582 RepID=A0A1F5EIK9_9BACT|nr:MAG: hypothetical protein A2442_04230 [Candidatus Campbellbacteria bacterium RIFOXYC2_FULL_35_25]
MRKVALENGEFYHIYNRGAGKCDVFLDKYDAERFLQSVKLFNNIEPIGSIFDLKIKEQTKKGLSDSPRNLNKKLVNIVCYCFNPNHYHFILEQLVDGGISEFMKRLGGGYTQAFNLKYKRSGVLFQGKFKSVHIESNEQLLHDSVYVNLNNKVHKKFDGIKKHFLDLNPNRSSWDEYHIKGKKGFCKKGTILDQFKDIKDYKKFAEETLKEIREMRYGNE